jgi:hypothetical protein
LSRLLSEVKATTELTTPAGTLVPAGTVLTAAGSFVTDLWSPVKPTGLDGTAARLHTHTTFDEGAPNLGINPTTTQPYNLPTTATVTTAAAEAGSPDPAEPLPSGEPVVSIQQTGYAPIDGAALTAPTSGWTLGAATVITTSTLPNSEAEPGSKKLYNPPAMKPARWSWTPLAIRPRSGRPPVTTPGAALSATGTPAAPKPPPLTPPQVAWLPLPPRTAKPHTRMTEPTRQERKNAAGTPPR